MGKTATLANIGSVADGSLGFRNRIINGAMVIDQRNAGAAVTLTTGAYFVDRYYTNINPGSGHTGQRVTTVPNGNFINSIKLTVGTGGTATAAQQARFVQSIEGLNIYDLGWGTANAQAITLSFWVRSSVTGTYPVGFANDSGAACYVGTYTISAADTWTFATITVPGPTSGTWITANDRGIKVAWGLGAGSNYNQAAGSWSYSGTDQYSVSGAANWVGTSGATWYITGVQLEKGSTATSFDYRPYGTELQLCQRYCYAAKPVANGAIIGLGQAYSATAAIIGINVPSPMRSTPTLTRNGLSVWNANVGSDLAVSAATIADGTPSFVRIDVTVASGLAAGNAVFLEGTTTPSGTGYLILSSEL